MPANDSLLFIDSNIYLELYRRDQVKKLLALLAEQIDYIFVTQQIVNEVQRNKIQVAADFLGSKSKQLKLETVNLPDHLSSTTINQRNDILQRMPDKKEIKKINNEKNVFMLRQISCSEDEVSKTISPIFANALPHSSEELQRARERKELGNPPGKMKNPIGDQLTWEQILTHFKDKKRLWIISGDGDYGTVYNDEGFLNRFLYDELCQITSEPEVYLFKDIVKGIEHFVKTTGVKAEQRLTPEEAEEIEREEKALPDLNQSSENLQKMLQNMERLTQPSDRFLKAMENVSRQSTQMRSDRLLKAMENIKPLAPMRSDRLLKAMENIKPLAPMMSNSFLKVMENIEQQLNQPRNNLQKKLEDLGRLTQLNYEISNILVELQLPLSEENGNDDKNDKGKT